MPCKVLPPFEAETLDGEVGVTVVDWEASQQLSNYWHPVFGEGGVIYDSCLKFGSGKYVSGFRVKLADIEGEEEVGIVEVISEDDELIAGRVLTTGDFSRRNVYQYFPLEFSLSRKGKVFVRFYASGQKSLCLDSVVFSLPGIYVDTDYMDRDFYSTVKDIRVRLYECEELPRTTGSKLSREYVSSGGIVGYRHGKDPPGTLVFGPYERYLAGEYRVVFRLRVSDNSVDKPILKLDVFSHSPDRGTEVKIARELKASDFSLRDNYQDFSLDFTSNGYQEELEFRVEVWGGVDIEADTITVYPG